jgi:cyclomaltodextrinase / maltogenic alpha-amylase / neopullulanase
MEEFIFGTLATDELKLVHHRAAQSGLQHGHDRMPRDPEPGQPITLTVRVGPDLAADRVACYYSLDGREPAGSHGVAHHGQVLMLELAGVEWDTLAWGYVARWQATLPEQPLGAIVRYCIGAWASDGPETFADWPKVQARAEQAASAFFRGEPFSATPLSATPLSATPLSATPLSATPLSATPLSEVPPGDPARGHTFALPVDRLRPPAWAREAVIYQVFVDRFCPGQDRDWRQTADLLEPCGGTLRGVVEKLEYVADLGASCLWLTPIFVSDSHHGYDATDLYHVEPRLGGDEALHELVAEAHARGIRVLLDYACNHVSFEHPIFQEALRNHRSRYRDWFTFDDSEIGYRTFFGVPSMPQVNVAHPEARDWLIDVARYWLREFDVDGYRLDYANGPGPDFWTDFWTACKAAKPDCYCFGEVIDAPSVQRTYVGRLDGCLDFHTADALRRTFALGTWSEEHLERFLTRHQAFFPDEWLMPTFLDNHDMDRFLFVAGGDKGALRRAAAVQMRLPGPPIIYYGTEVGLNQAVSIQAGAGMHVNRVPMVWGDAQDRDLLAYYRSLIQERRERQRRKDAEMPVLQPGGG